MAKTNQFTVERLLEILKDRNPKDMVSIEIMFPDHFIIAPVYSLEWDGKGVVYIKSFVEG